MSADERLLARDAALTRISRTRRWVIAGTAAFTAGFAALVSIVAPGRSTAATASKTSAPSSASTGSAQTQSSGSGGLQPAGQAPQSDPYGQGGYGQDGYGQGGYGQGSGGPGQDQTMPNDQSSPGGVAAVSGGS